jgi:hypothetical protein
MFSHHPRLSEKEAGMRIYTVTCDGTPAAVVRADDRSEAIDIARELGREVGLLGPFAAREPEDAEMVSWLARRCDHLLPESVPLAAAS